MFNPNRLCPENTKVNHSAYPLDERGVSAGAIAARSDSSEPKRGSVRRIWDCLPAIIAVLLIAAAVVGSPVNAPADSSTSLMNKVDAALRADRRLNGAACYTAAPGAVVLYGTVFDDKARTLAEKTARKVHGVKKVINTLGTTTGRWLEEEVRINDTLRLNGFEGVSARIIGSDAYVSGQVSSEAEKQRAARVISSISKLGVVNFIRVVPGRIF